MEYLNRQREKLNAIGAMAEITQLQTNLVAQVQQRMRTISNLESGGPSEACPATAFKQPGNARVDPEVDMWKKKIAKLMNEGPPPTSSANSGNIRERFNANLPIPAPRKVANHPQAPSGIRRKKQSGVRRSKKNVESASLLSSSSYSSQPAALPLTSDASKDLLSSPNRNNSKNSSSSSSSRAREREAKANSLSSSSASSNPIVKGVEEKISKINRRRTKGVDKEVEMWKKKIAELSSVNPTKNYSSPITDSGFSPSSARGSGLDAVKRRNSRSKTRAREQVRMP